MQTFLPYEDFTLSAQVLDYRRLGKQRVEALQIYNVLVDNPSRSNVGRLRRSVVALQKQNDRRVDN
jgi:hypothetical protein